MSLPEGLSALLRAAYEAGAAGEASTKAALEKTLLRIEIMDSTQSGVYGQAATDFLTHVHVKTPVGLRCIKDRSGQCTVPPDRHPECKFDHANTCCAFHKTHVTPHRGCILR